MPGQGLVEDEIVDPHLVRLLSAQGKLLPGADFSRLATGGKSKALALSEAVHGLAVYLDAFPTQRGMNPAACPAGMLAGQRLDPLSELVVVPGVWAVGQR